MENDCLARGNREAKLEQSVDPSFLQEIEIRLSAQKAKSRFDQASKMFIGECPLPKADEPTKHLS